MVWVVFYLLNEWFLLFMTESGRYDRKLFDAVRWIGWVLYEVSIILETCVMLGKDIWSLNLGEVIFLRADFLRFLRE